MLGQHLVNLKCMFPSYTDAEVFYSIQLTWALVPPLLLLACIATWYLVAKCTICFGQVTELEIKIKSSCIALLYLLWPSLSSTTFSLFACRSVCDEANLFLRADLSETCWKDRHLDYALAVGFPMLLLYVIGLPVAAYLRVRKMHKELDKHHARTGNYTEGLEKVFKYDRKFLLLLLLLLLLVKLLLVVLCFCADWVLVRVDAIFAVLRFLICFLFCLFCRQNLRHVLFSISQKNLVVGRNSSWPKNSNRNDRRVWSRNGRYASTFDIHVGCIHTSCDCTSSTVRWQERRIAAQVGNVFFDGNVSNIVGWFNF